jgi:teichuronic acid biosynthesis glycosyltransferase TuaC
VFRHEWATRTPGLSAPLRVNANGFWLDPSNDPLRFVRGPPLVYNASQSHASGRLPQTYAVLSAAQRQRVRVLTFTSLFPNSVQPNLGIFVYQRMAAFAALPGNSVEVIAPLPWSPPVPSGEKGARLRKIPPQEAVGGITVHHPRYPLLPRVSMALHARLMYLGCIALARELHAQNPFDCVDAHYVYPDGKAALLIANALGLPAIISARGSDINLFPTFRLIRPQIRATLRDAAGRIAVSEALKQAMLDVAEAPCDIRVIGNGVDPARFFSVSQAEARAELKIPQDSRVIICVAALVPVKGHDRLLRVFRQLAAKQPGLHLYMVGEGASRTELEALAASLGLRERAHFVGSCLNDRLRFWYSAADVSCLASSREGWPNVVLESLACGTPVVATRVWGTPEILTSPELGILVEQSDESLASGLESALARHWDRRRMVQFARARDWPTVAREVDSYFREIWTQKR